MEFRLFEDDNSMLAKTKNIFPVLGIKNNYTNRNPLLRYIFWRRLEVILRMAENVHSFESVLDFGCGEGVLLLSLSKLFKMVYGVDINQNSIRIARKLAHILNCNNVCITLVTPPQELSSIRTKEFDCIISADVLEHIPHVRQTLFDFNRILKGKGELICSIPKENQIYISAKRLLRHPPEKDGHVVGYKEIVELIEKYFIVEEASDLIFFKILRCVKKSRGN
jgi:ubiquinone/menaquinone biosynthesis C-methylase UbiE